MWLADRRSALVRCHQPPPTDRLLAARSQKKIHPLLPSRSVHGALSATANITRAPGLVRPIPPSPYTKVPEGRRSLPGRRVWRASLVRAARLPRPEGLQGTQRRGRGERLRPRVRGGRVQDETALRRGGDTREVLLRAQGELLLLEATFAAFARASPSYGGVWSPFHLWR